MKMEEVYGNLPVIETERLILRKVTLDDANDVFLYGSNEEVSKYVTWNTHQTLSESEGFIQFILEQYENKKLGLWGIEYKENGQFIGTIDFVSWQPHHKIAETGYVLSQDYWSKGIITEAAKELIKFGFENMDLARIQARCFIENIGSWKVMEKIGMTFEGIIRNGMYIKGKQHDLKMYSIIKEEYFAENK
ncbi:GNAT family N-acetyltransferase [Bacillus sp. CGMCC 1.16607]|uniref:GNAT family N-acetyltransferase n=1 Tax=Bacillus sp. CGMCC 1.16607 TaxID=3351842 RepID=UPI0036450A8F